MRPAMTDPTLVRVREATAAYAGAVRETQRFFDRLDDTIDPAVLAEYANLLRREDAARTARRDALDAAGVNVGSIDNPDG
jgi:hypothetical protein